MRRGCGGGVRWARRNFWARAWPAELRSAAENCAPEHLQQPLAAAARTPALGGAVEHVVPERELGHGAGPGHDGADMQESSTSAVDLTATPTNCIVHESLRTLSSLLMSDFSPREAPNQLLQGLEPGPAHGTNNTRASADRTTDTSTLS